MSQHVTVPPSPGLPASPCIRVCTLDDDGVCIGCGRHVDEITAWTRMTSAEQRSVLELSLRRKAKRDAQRMNFK